MPVELHLFAKKPYLSQLFCNSVAITDADNRILYVNPAYEKITGYKLKNVIGKKPSISKSGRHGPEFYRKMWAALNKELHWEGKIWDRSEDGAVFPKLMSIDRLVDEEGKTRNFIAILLQCFMIFLSKKRRKRKSSDYSIMIRSPRCLIVRCFAIVFSMSSKFLDVKRHVLG